MRNIVFPITISLVIALSPFVRRSYSDDIARIVARVNGEDIFYAEVRASPERVNRALEKRHGGGPADRVEDQLRSLRSEIEASHLGRVLRQKIRDAELTRLGVLPSDAEIKARCDRDYPPDERKARGEEMRDAARVILRAYERVFVEGDAPGDVYAELLKDQMTSEEWQLRVKYDINEKSIRNLRGALNRSAEELFNCKALMQQLISIEREGPAIDREIAKSDVRYAKYLQLAAEDPRSPLLRDKGPMYREARRAQWWREQYRQADITILDPRFAKVLDSLRNGGDWDHE